TLSKKCESQWKRNIKKQRINTGMSYKTISNKFVPPRSLRKPCGEKCRLNYSKKFSEESRHASKVVPNYRHTLEGSTRSNSMAFYLEIHNNLVRVSKIQNAFLSEEQMEKHEKQRKSVPAIKKSIRKHIESFLQIESHYLRNQTSREYVDGGLAIAAMHRLYIEDCNTKGLLY
ncbi:hypothetical protein ILUMI_17144, partial [Ignelater luminosus]